MKTGKVPDGSKSEWFWRGTRLAGSCTTRPLPTPLKQTCDVKPLHPTLRRLIDKRDRCAAQFQGKNAFYSNQEFERRTSTAVVDLSQTSCHGKGCADGASNVPTFHLRQAAKDGAPVSAGTRGLVLFLATKMCKPANAKTDAWMSCDEYLVAYYPEDAFTPDDYIAKSGYEGSNQDHFYTNSGLGRLAARHLRCMCTPCVTNSRLYSGSCQFVDEWCGKIRHYNLEAGTARVVRVKPRRELWSLEEFAESLGTKAMRTRCGMHGPQR